MKRNTTVSVFSFWVLIIQFAACQCLICHIATKWDQENKICADCDHDTFMPEHDHNHTECYPCTRVTDVLNEYVIRECSLEEDALIGSSRSNKTPCLDDTFYVRVNSDGGKVCTVKTMPCKQGQFSVSGHTCAPCPPGTYMVDNHHNNTACNLCQQLLHNQEFDGYVATACNITGNSTSGSDGQDGSPVDTASFNCSHRPDVDNNAADQKSAAPTERDANEVFRILQIIIRVLVFVILLVLPLIKYVAVFDKLYLTLMKYCMDKHCALCICMRVCLYTGIALAVVCSFVALIVQSKGLALSIFLLLMEFVAELCIGAGIVIAILNMLQLNMLQPNRLQLNMLQLKHLSHKTSGCEHLLDNKKKPNA